MDAKEISLEEKKVKPVVDHLNDLLANYHIHYQKLRGCHWNVKGKSFFTLLQLLRRWRGRCGPPAIKIRWCAGTI
jgi:DNA-binding ferritin-like protein